MATNKNITMKQFNGTDYDTLYPKTKVEQVEGAYTQQQILANSTKAMFGMGSNAVPDDVLAYLGRYNQYWWSVLHGEAYHYYEEAKSDITSSISINDGYARTISYSSQISIEQSTGAVTLLNPQTFSVTRSTSSSTFAAKMQELADLAPIYVTNLYDNASAVYYIPSGANVGTSGTTIIYNSYNSAYRGRLSNDAVNKAKLVTSELVQVPAGETTYVHSSERNAYPDSGTVDDFTYQYLGIPFDNAVTAPKIATGSYTGTGTYGSSNPNSLTFDFEPKIVIIQSDSERASGQFPYIWGASYMYVTRGSNSDSNIVSVSSNTMSWYCSESSSSNAKTQLNSSGVVYSYIAIC